MTNLDINFIKADPSGNTTILVLTPLSRKLYASAARLLMRENVLCAEQVGFVEKTAAGSRLHMMGGEFCGNASRSYAAWLLMGGQEYLQQGGKMLRPLPPQGGSLNVEVSGHEGSLYASAEDTGSSSGCFAEIEMPNPGHIFHGRDELLGKYSLVAFTGISHCILWEQAANAGLLPRLRALLRESSLDDSCCGMMFVERQEPLFMRPLVYVGEVDSLVWEQSCGSGSLALMCALADREQKSFRRLPIQQPGGELLLSGEYGPGGITRNRLAGEVHFTAQGTAHITLE